MIHARPRLRDLPAAILALASHVIAAVRERWDGYLVAARAREAAEARQWFRRVCEGMSVERTCHGAEADPAYEARVLGVDSAASLNWYTTKWKHSWEVDRVTPVPTGEERTGAPLVHYAFDVLDREVCTVPGGVGTINPSDVECEVCRRIVGVDGEHVTALPGGDT